LGKAIAAGFAREGAHVVICSRDARKLKSAAVEIRAIAAHGATIVPVKADVTKPLHIRRLVAAAMKQFGRVDVLVTNAGGPPVGAFPDLDDASWKKGIDLNLLSTIRCIREVLPHMIKQKWGRIIAITSFTAKQPADDLAISSTLRPGIMGLAKILANQYGKKGILVNSVAPGFILTSRQREISESRAKKVGMSTEHYIEEQAAGMPAGRLGTPEELADVVVFLGSERASYVNGAAISVDGGFIKGLF
jgi:3-oxoacyl-[acyl-carrier protein] reductase